MGSITANGGYTQVWMRETLGPAAARPGRRQELHQRGHAATRGLPDQDLRPQPLRLSQRQGRSACQQHAFGSPRPAGSSCRRPRAASARSCRPGSVRSSPHGRPSSPASTTGPATQTSWTPVAEDAADKDPLLHPAGLRGAAGGRIGRPDRQGRSGACRESWRTAGSPIRGFLMQAYDCKARTVVAVSADSYDAAGVLIGRLQAGRRRSWTP